MTKRGRKRISTLSRKKPKGKSSTEETDKSNDKEESWILMEFTSCEELESANAALCDTESCTSSALFIYEGMQSKKIWRSCVD